MIEEKKGFWVNGKVYASRNEAQLAGLTEILRPAIMPGDDEQAIIELIIHNSPAIVGLLTGVKPRKARSDRGQPRTAASASKKAVSTGGVTVEASSKYANK